MEEAWYSVHHTGGGCMGLNKASYNHLDARRTKRMIRYTECRAHGTFVDTLCVCNVPKTDQKRFCRLSAETYFAWILT